MSDLRWMLHGAREDIAERSRLVVAGEVLLVLVLAAVVCGEIVVFFRIGGF